MPKPIDAQQQAVEERREQLAINLADLDRVHPEFRIKVRLAQKLNLRNPITVEDNEKALIFECQLLTAAIICDLIRTQNREAKEPLVRVYIKRVEAWSRLSDATILTWVNSVCEYGNNARSVTFLSPIVFPPIVKPEDLEPQPAHVVKLGS